ncbi:acylphosphatase [Naasia aerilata]|uniref:Acylphosphatase n=1 Tax=Naasia aerilata TaxID=1162966 RepID=A0ABM8GFE3_9MICO|nr:acylphosphatase [Naasia aerilata]BDZ47078.1 acylphosphatase [Naasia aerilata]
MARIGRHAVVSGRVQGVGFRWSCANEAKRLGVGGWVRNLPDGRVEVHVEGEEGPVEALLAWLHSGPAFARVTSVEVTDATPTGATSFDVT